MACSHAPLPETIVIESSHDPVEVTLASSLDPRSWPRHALCRLCGRPVRLRGLFFPDWELAGEEPRVITEAG